MPITGEWTNDDLILGAAERGFELTTRRITDWTERGLLDRPKVRGTGRGSKKAVRPDHQANLLWTLLAQQRGGASKITTLANIPVFIWLRWGGEYVSIGQVRRAMRTFAENGTKASVGRAKQSARDYVELLQLGPVPVAQRERLEKVLIRMSATKHGSLEPLAAEFTDALRGLVAPNGTSFDLPIVEGILWGVDCRMRAAKVFGDGTDEKTFTDQHLKTVQSFYQLTSPQYAAEKDLTVQALNQEQANSACNTLLLLLGRDLTPFALPGQAGQHGREAR